MTREQLQQRIGDLEGQLQLLTLSRISAGNPTCQDVLNTALANMTQKDSTAENVLNTSVSDLASSRCRCVAAGYNSPGVEKKDIKECKQYEMKLKTALDNAHDRGVSATEVRELNSLLGNDNTAAIDSTIARINTELTELNADLATAPDKQSDVLDATGEPFDPTDRWFSFAYEYDKSEKKTTTSAYDSTYSSVSSSYRRSNSYSWWWRRGSSSSSSYSSSRSSSLSRSFETMTNSQRIRVKGKLLRVTCQRPWFRPSLFRNKRYKIVSFLQLAIYEPCMFIIVYVNCACT